MSIEDFVDNLGWSIVGDFKNGGLDAAEHVGQLFEVS